VARIAELFGGGGHRNAAGCTLTGAWDEAERTIVGLLINAVEHNNLDTSVPPDNGHAPRASVNEPARADNEEHDVINAA